MPLLMDIIRSGDWHEAVEEMLVSVQKDIKNKDQVLT